MKCKLSERIRAMEELVDSSALKEEAKIKYQQELYMLNKIYTAICGEEGFYYKSKEQAGEKKT